MPKAWIYNSFDLSEGGQEASDGLLDGWLAPAKNRTQTNMWMFPKLGVVPRKSSILIGFSFIFTIHFGVPLFLETPMCFVFCFEGVLFFWGGAFGCWPIFGNEEI